MSQKLPPQNLEAEFSVLGGLMLEREAFDQVSDLIDQGDFYKPAEVRLNQLLAELPKLEAEVDFLKVNKLSAADVLHEADTLHDRWPKMDVSEKRKIVEALIEKVVIGNGEIDITYSHLPTSIQQCKNQQSFGPG